MKALGLIETVGLPVAIEAADAAVKSANVTLVGYDNAKGGGLITVKVQGDVGAVKAAVQAASVAAKAVGKVYGTHVIPRPAPGIEELLGIKNPPPTPKPVSVEEPPVVVEPVITEPEVIAEPVVVESAVVEPTIPEPVVEPEIVPAPQEEKPEPKPKKAARKKPSKKN